MPVSPMLIQQDPALKRKYELAQALAGQSLSGAPVQSPWEALSRVGQAYFAKKGMDSAETEMAGRNEAARKTLAEAMTPNRVQTPFIDEAGEAMGVGTPQGLVASEQDVPKNYQQMAAVLAGNKDTAPYGLQLQMADAEQKLKSQSEIQQLLLKHQLDRTGKKEDMTTWLDFAKQLSGGNMQPGQSLKISPKGPEISFDPAAAQRAEIERKRLAWETGIGADGGGPSAIPPKQQAEIDAKRIQDKPAAQKRLQSAISRADIVSNKVDEALSNVGFFTTGLPGAALGMIPGRDAYNLDRTLDTIKANIGFQELAAMREASPTGGALGQVAVKELDFLQAAIASLDKGQDPETLKANLQAVKTHFNNWKSAVQNAYEQNYGTAANPPSNQANPDQGYGHLWK